MTIRANKDTLLVIWVLWKLGWSPRRIARVILPKSHHTVTVYLGRACELIEAGELHIAAKGERAVRLRYCGSTKDVEDIDGFINGNQCGGGRRVRPHHFNGDWEEKKSEDYEGSDG